jgi:hypothetical protein
MSVLMVDASLAVRRREPDSRDAHGERVYGDWGDPVGPWPGHTRETSDGTWTLGLDPQAWPVRAGDLIVDDGGREWLVDTTVLLRNALDPTVDWIRVTAHQRVDDQTEPGGPEYTGRG